MGQRKEQRIKVSDVGSQTEGRGAPPRSPAGTVGQVLFPQVLQSSGDLGSCGNVVWQEIEPSRNEGREAQLQKSWWSEE